VTDDHHADLVAQLLEVIPKLRHLLLDLDFADCHETLSVPATHAGRKPSGHAGQSPAGFYVEPRIDATATAPAGEPAPAAPLASPVDCRYTEGFDRAGGRAEHSQ
jgi:hypothetical protein